MKSPYSVSQIRSASLRRANYPFGDLFGFGLSEIIGDFNRAINGSAEHRGHHYLTIEQDCDWFAYVACSCLAHFLCALAGELDAHRILACNMNRPGCRDITVCNDDVLMKVDRTVLARKLYFGQSRTRLVFGQPDFKANCCMYFANDWGPQPPCE